jgi:aminopeptidase N
VEERIVFVGDRWALMEAGQAPVGAYLDLALALKNDPNSNVLDAALGKVASIDQRIASPEDSERLHAVLRRELLPVYKALGGHQKDEAQEHLQRRSLFFNLLGLAEDPDVLKQAVDITTALFSGKMDATDPALNDAAVALTTKNGTSGFYDAMLKVSRDSSNPAMQEETMGMLAGFEDPELVQRTLEYAVSGQVRNQDSWQLIAALLRHKNTRAQAWDFVQKNWDKVHAQLTASSGQRIVGSTGSFCTVAERDEVQSFFAAHPVENTERTLKQAYEASSHCIALKAAQEPKLKEWLDGHR